MPTTIDQETPLFRTPLYDSLLLADLPDRLDGLGAIFRYAEILDAEPENLDREPFIVSCHLNAHDLASKLARWLAPYRDRFWAEREFDRRLQDGETFELRQNGYVRYFGRIG